MGTQAKPGWEPKPSLLEEIVAGTVATLHLNIWEKKWIHLSMQKTSHLIYPTPLVYSFPAFALEVCQAVYTECNTLQVCDCFSFFFKIQSQRRDFFPFILIFPKGQRQSYSLCEEAEISKKFFAFICMASHVPLARLWEGFCFIRITWRADAYKWKMKLLLLSPGPAKANKCRANCVCKGRALRKLEVSWIITSL